MYTGAIANSEPSWQASRSRPVIDLLCVPPRVQIVCCRRTEGSIYGKIGLAVDRRLLGALTGFPDRTERRDISNVRLSCTSNRI